jgi:hypothetical protein
MLFCAPGGMNHTKTRAVQVAIGERRKPQPGAGQAICVSTQYIREIWTESRACITSNAVDEVTQWQVVGAVSAGLKRL